MRQIRTAARAAIWEPKDTKTWAIQSPVRGLMVPVLGPGRLSQLADEMARHGFNTLFYPVLYGGYATFPSETFPLHPALREADGWAAAVNAMRGKGIAVVGYLETLAWQTEGDRAHWLNDHKELLDVDALGRPRLSWLEAHPDAGGGNPGTVSANYVSPLAPGVEERLNRFLGDFARRPDATAVGFSSFRPPEIDSESLYPPALGFSLPERLAVFRATGQDPVDTWRTIYDPMPEAIMRLWRKNLFPLGLPGDLPDLRAALVARLLDKARALKPTWKTYLLDDVEVQRKPRTAPAAERPTADVTVSVSGWDRSGAGHLLRVGPPRKAPPATVPGALDLSGIPPMVVATLINEPAAARSKVAVVYDFRAVPNEITEALQWIMPPEKVAGNH